MFIKTSDNNYGEENFASFERRGNIQISNITFYYNCFPAGNNMSMESFRI